MPNGLLARIGITAAKAELQSKMMITLDVAFVLIADRDGRPLQCVVFRGRR